MTMKGILVLRPRHLLLFQIMKPRHRNEMTAGRSKSALRAHFSVRENSQFLTFSISELVFKT